MASTLTFAIPVDWSATTAYEVNTIVFVGKKAYTALQDVPVGTDITNTAYWAETGVPYVDVASIYNRLDAVEGDVGDLDTDVTQAKADIVVNANAITGLTTRLNAAVSALESDVARVNNIMITLYTPPTSNLGGN